MSLDVGTVQGGIQIDDKFSSVFSAFQTGTSQIIKSISDLITKVDGLHEPTTRTKSDTDLAAEAQRKAAVEINSATEAYRRLAGQLDPVTAGTNKYANAHKTLDTALAHGIITHQQYESALESAGEKFISAGQGASVFESLIGKITELVGLAGPAAAEAGEALGGLASKSTSITELIASLGPLAPALIVIAAAVAGIGIAWEAFKFLQDAIKEGADFEQVVAKLNNTLIANGSASGLSAHEIVQLADSMSAASAQPTAEILKGITVLTQFQKIGHDTFTRATQDVLDYAAQTGKAPEEAFEKFGRALEGGQRGLRALEEVGGVFLAGQKATLKAMLDNGDVIGYQTKLLSILEDHVRGAADAYAQTFNGQVKNAENALKDLKEGIASEVIPVLEDLINHVVGQLGGWANLREFIKSVGHDIGGFIRQMVGDIYIAYQSWEESQDNLDAYLTKSFLSIVNTVAGVLVSITSFIGKLPTPDAKLWQSAASAINSANVSISASLIKTAGDAQRSAESHNAAVMAEIASLNAHRQALEGDETVQGKHSSTLDSIANKTKDLSAIYQSIAKDIQTYADKVFDLTSKQTAQTIAQNALLAAVSRGQIAYNIEKQSQADAAAVEAVTTALLIAHRTEIEKLTDAQQKLIEKKDTAGAAKVQAEINAENNAYASQVKILSDQASANIKLKQSIADKETALKDDLPIQTKYSTTVAQLTDTITGTVDASRAQATQTDVTAEVVKRATAETVADGVAVFGLTSKILDEVSARHAETNAINDAITAAKSYNNLANQASFQTAISQIDSSGSIAAQDLETKYLTLLKDLGKGSIEQGQTVIDEANATFAAFNINFRITADGIKSSLQTIQDAALVTKYKNYTKSIYQQYADERAAIEDLMSRSADRVHLTVAQGLKALEEIQTQYINTQLTAWGSLFGILSSEFGGVFTQLDRFVKILQEIQTIKSDVSTIISSLTGVFSTSITGSAVALDGSASALDAAAVALGEAAGASAVGSGVGAGVSGGVSSGVSAGAGAGTATAASSGYLSGFAGAATTAAGWTVAVLAVLNLVASHHSSWASLTLEVQNAKLVAGDADGLIDNAALLFPIVSGIIDSVNTFITSVGGQFETLTGQLKIKRDGRSKNTDYTVDYTSGAEQLVADFGNDYKAAMEFAVVQALKQSKIGGISPELQTAITNSVATTISDFNTDIQTATNVIHARLGSVGSQIYDIDQKYDQEIAAAKALGLSETDLIASRNKEISSIADQILGINTAVEDNLTALISFQKGIKETTDNINAAVTTGLGATIDAAKAFITQNADLAAQYHLAQNPGNTLLDHSLPPVFEDASGKVADAATEAILEKVAKLKSAIEDWTDQLDAVPEALTDTQIAGAVFGDLYDNYIKGTKDAAKYAQEELDFARQKVQLEFDAYKVQIVALGLWDKYAGLWQDAYNNALAAVGASPGTSQHGDEGAHQIAKPPAKTPGTGRDSGSSSDQTPAQQLEAIFSTFYTSLLPQLSQQIAAINDKWDKALALTGKNSEAIGRINAAREHEIELLEKQARDTAIANVNSFLAQGGPAITQQIQAVRDSADGLVDGLRDLHNQGALSTQQLHSLVAAIRSAEQAQIDAVKNTVLKSIDTFSDSLSNTGLTATLANIDTQAGTLRDSLNQLAAAGALTADEFYKDAQQIIDADNAQKQAAITNAANSLLNELYGYLKDDKDAAKLKYTLTVAELEVQRNQLALAGYSAAALSVIDGLIAQVVAGGPALFESGSPDATGPNPANALADAANQQSSASSDLQSAADALKAAVQSLSDYGESLLTNSTLSALTPADQLSQARAQLLADYSLAKTGDTGAITAYQGLANVFLQLAKSQDISNASYGVDFKLVLDEINSITGLGNAPVSTGGPGGVPTGFTPFTYFPLPTIPPVGATPDTTPDAAGAKTINDLTTAAQRQADSNQQLVDLTKANVGSISSLYTRNHDDLSAVSSNIKDLASVVAAQQAQLDRLVSYIGGMPSMPH